MEWNEPLYREGSGDLAQVGLLVLHGFTGSPRSMQELALRVAGEGYTVALPLLAGHGSTPLAMEKARWSDWTADAEQALSWLERRTGRMYVCGLSMGGTLALWLAERHPELAGVITINALIRHPQEPFMRILGRIGIPRWTKGVRNDIKKPGEDEMAYERVPIRAARELALLVRAVRRDLAAVSCPILIFSSPEDHVVPPQNQQEIYETVSSQIKKLIELPNSYHVATMDNDKELIFSEVLKFMASDTPSDG
ncbi:MAG: alpha/beta fold hydrolase [Thermoleophilia bacterium]|nr:alpha/beta fold hydrolase [Thermoleophilia bacterium]